MMTGPSAAGTEGENRPVGRLIAQLGGETLVYGIAGSINRFISVLLVPLYARAFSPSEYGVFGILAALAALLTQITGGLDNASGRWFFDSHEPAHKQSVIASWFWFQITTSILLGVLLVAAARPLAAALLGSPADSLLIVLAAMSVVASLFGKVFSNWLRYVRRPLAMLLFSSVSSCWMVALTACFLLVWQLGVPGAYWAQVIGGAAVGIVVLFIMRDWVGPRLWSQSLFSEMLKFSLPVMPATIAAWAISSADRFVLKYYLDTSEIGLYFVALQLASIIGVLDGAFQMAWGPFAFSVLHNPNSGDVYSRVFSLYGMVGCLFGTALSLFATPLLALIAPPAYQGAASSVPFLSFFLLAIGATNVVGIGSAIAKDSRPIAINIYLGAGISLSFMLALIPVIGRNGAALAKLIAMCAAAVYMYMASQKRHPIPFRVSDAMLFLGLSWACIGVDYLFVKGWDWFACALRLGMCGLFIPVGLWLGILPRKLATLTGR